MAAHRHRRLGGAYSGRSAGRCHAPTLDSLAGRPQLRRRLGCVPPGCGPRGNGGEDAPLPPCLDARMCVVSPVCRPARIQPGALPLVTEVRSGLVRHGRLAETERARSERVTPMDVAGSVTVHDHPQGGKVEATSSCSGCRCIAPARRIGRCWYAGAASMCCANE